MESRPIYVETLNFDTFFFFKQEKRVLHVN